MARARNATGWGASGAFDPAKVIVDAGKPLFDGGLGPGAGSWQMQQRIEELAKKNRIDLSKPFDELSKKARETLVDGAAGLPGILAVLEETYQSSSEAYREWLTEYMSPAECPACQGKRLRPASLAVRVKNFAISEFTGLPIARALMTVRNWELNARETQIAGRVVDEIRRRLEFLSAVGLDYLSLERSSATLSGGEAQRIRLATQIGSKLRGVLYVLDEPSIGLHPRDNNRLLETLTHLRDMGNTVLVVEHDAETIERADYVIDLGPGAGRLGGELVASGTPREIERNAASLTGQYLSGTQSIPVPAIAAQGQRQATGDPRGARAQPEGRERRDSAGRADGGDGRVGQREIDADQRDSLPRAGQGGLRVARRAGGARCDRGDRTAGQGDPHRPGGRSGARRAPIPRLTRGCSRRFGICTPCCRNRASAGTSRGGSAST